MDEKTAFIAESLRGERPMTTLCERYGISRDTGYRLLGRYREEGPGGLAARSRAPHRHGMTIAGEVAEAIVALRRERPFWGPKKLRAVLQRRDPKRLWPAAAASGAAEPAFSAGARAQRPVVHRLQGVVPHG